jgi:hypothetical protein
MKKANNYYDGILTKLYKKEQDEKLRIGFKNTRSIINNRSPYLALSKVYSKKVNKSNPGDDIGKKAY